MGAAASAASPYPEATAAVNPPANEDIQLAAAADVPQEAIAPADSPAKEEIQPAAAADADAPGGDAEAAGETVVLDGAAAEAGDEDEEEESPFCVFMKGGECKDEFVAWEKCVEEADAEGGDPLERCGKLAAALATCMDNNPEYYEPALGCSACREYWKSHYSR